MSNLKDSMSLAKLSKELFDDLYDLKQKKEDFFNNVISKITDQFSNKEIGHKNEVVSKKINDDLWVFVYETRSDTPWKNFIQNEFKVDLNLENLSNSYLLVFNVKNSVYTLTTGLANNIIDKYKDKSFGLRILTKLFKEDDPVIKKKVQSLIAENRSASSSTYRSNTSFSSELLITSIKRNLTVEANEITLESMGVIEKNKDGSLDNMTLNVKFGNNIEINKKLALDEMKRVINKISYIDNEMAILFALDNITLAEKKNFTQAEIKENLIAKIKTYIKNLSIPYTEFINFENLTLYNGNHRVVDKEKLKEINSFEKLNKYIKNKFLKDNPKSILEYYFVNEDDTKKIRLYDLLEVEVEHKSHQFYLIDGSFYTFDKAYDEFYEEKYKKLFNDSKKYVQGDFIYKRLNKDLKKSENECVFNKSLKKEANIILADKKQYKRIELADAISIKDNEIIFFHNKTNFNGSGVRDVTNQILTSANYLKGFLDNLSKETSSFDKYIERLKKENENKDELIDNFYEMLKDNNTKITYIAAFINDVSVDTESNYIKYLLEATKTQLNNFDFYIY